MNIRLLVVNARIIHYGKNTHTKRYRELKKMLLVVLMPHFFFFPISPENIWNANCEQRFRVQCGGGSQTCVNA